MTNPVTPSTLAGLVEKWRKDIAGYPQTEQGRWAYAAVSCCINELEAALLALPESAHTEKPD